MNPVISMFVLVYGNIYQKYLNKGEDIETACLLTSSQITVLLLLNIMSLVFLFSPFVALEGGVFGAMPRYQVFILIAILIGGAALVLHKRFDWNSSFKARYYEMLELGQFKRQRLATKLVPYVTMLLFVSSITFAIAYG